MTYARQKALIEAERTFIQQENAAHDATCPPGVARVRACLPQHLFERRLTTAALLARCQVQEGRIHRLFQEAVGMGIRDYREHQRLMAAVRLLRHEELTIYSIAFGIGYNSYRTFARAFHRRFHCSPQDYRERHYGVAA